MDANDRAASPHEMPHLGDPERWGGNSVIDITLDAFNSDYVKRGRQFIRVQLPNLMARAFDLTCVFSARGLDTSGGPPGDIPLYLLNLAWGTGQNSSIDGQIDLLAAATANPIWRKTTNTAGQVTAWSVSLPLAIPVVSLAITAEAHITATAPGVRTVRFEFDCFVSPRSLG
jgi:hypothetical protein